MRLYLVRHGKPDVPPGVCYGRSDVRVAEAEHDRIADDLAGQLPTEAPVFSSPAQRCLGLATRLGHALGTEPRTDPRLWEMDFGAWEMRNWEEIGRAAVDAWAADLLHYRPGGGESVSEVAGRVASFHAGLCEAGADVIVVCHAGTIRLLARLHQGLSVADSARAAAHEAHAIGYGELLVLD